MTQPYRPSNGTEGEIFCDNWCNKCERDAAYQADPERADGCVILSATLIYDLLDKEYPPEWIWDGEGYHRTPRCTAFVKTGGVVDEGPINDARQGSLLP
jgi:hypothetical protein